jgi:tRNA(Leu) C34 or U34 (ribose-2'-O)-methylase TrmL
VSRDKNDLTLVACDIEGNWNLPLLKSAAELSRAPLVYARSGEHRNLAAQSVPFEELATRFRTVLACETGTGARDVFEFPSPRVQTAVVVGNEETGIARSVLRRCSSVVTIPMFSRRFSSVNVGVASAIVLYVLSRDLARRGATSRRGVKSNLDLLIRAPADPAECGSLLRSAAAFGWKRVFLEDPERSWFSDTRDVVALSRAAARREINPIVVLKPERVQVRQYDRAILCSGNRTGTPLSRYRLKDSRSTLLIYGACSIPQDLAGIPTDEVYVDFDNPGAGMFFRHEGSVLLAVLARQLRGRPHG